MIDFLAFSVTCLAMFAGGFVLFRFADAVYRFLSRTPDCWEKEGVIRSGWSKVWREDNPQRFSFRVGSYRAAAVFAWFWFKLVGVILAFGAVVTFFKALWR